LPLVLLPIISMNFVCLFGVWKEAGAYVLSTQLAASSGVLLFPDPSGASIIAVQVGMYGNE
jgi:hypothetical protein